MIAADSAPRAFVISVGSGYGFIYEMMAGISDALTHHGWRSCVLNVSGMPALMNTTDILIGELSQGPALIVDYLGHHRFHAMKSFALHDFFIYMSDAPYAYFDNLLSIGADSVVGYSDESHAEFIEDHALPFQRDYFPHAGPEVEPNTKPLAEREFSFLFIANMNRSPRLDGLIQARTNQDMRRLTDTLIARVLDGGDEPYVAFKHACADIGIGTDVFPAPEHRARYLAHIAGWIEAKRRHDILVALRDRRIHVVGNIAANFFDIAMPNLVQLGEKTTVDCISAMENARVVVNSIAVRPAGAHERMWYAVSRGAALWTDPTSIVARDFPDGSVFTIPREAQDVRSMADAIAGRADLQGCVAAAQAAYTMKHTWRARVGNLLAQHRFEKAMGGQS